MKPGAIELKIDELVLHGFQYGDRFAIGDAIKSELKRLIAERGLPPSLIKRGDLSHLDAGGLNVSAGSRPEAIGANVARSIYGGFGK